MPLANAKQILAGMYEQGERDFRGFGDQLREVDLSGLNLEGGNLSGLDLAGTNFTQANLERANLTGANLGFATLVEAKLTRATLRNADLTCARAERADMRFCVFAKANLSGTNLLESQLEPSIFTDAVYNAKTQFPEGFDRAKKGLVRAAPTPQNPSLSSVVSPPPSATTTTGKIPPHLIGNSSSEPLTPQATPDSPETQPASNPQSDAVASDEQSQQQSQNPSSTPNKRKILFRGRWVEM